MTFAFIFSDVGFGEWFVLLAVILVVVGPKRLPETARKFGNWYAKFRRAADGFKRQLLDMDTEFQRAVSEAEKEADDAFKTGDETDSDASSADDTTDDVDLPDGFKPGDEHTPPPPNPDNGPDPKP